MRASHTSSRPRCWRHSSPLSILRKPRRASSWSTESARWRPSPTRSSPPSARTRRTRVDTAAVLPRVAVMVALALGSTLAAAQSPTTSTTALALFGPRAFTVGAPQVRPNQLLTVGLHPDAAPIRITWRARGFDVCPATTDGALGGTWPGGTFTTCVDGGAQRRVTLPAGDGNFHVAFAMRNRSGRRVAIRLRVRYVAVDSFVQIVPPAGGSAKVTF